MLLWNFINNKTNVIMIKKHKSNFFDDSDI